MEIIIDFPGGARVDAHFGPYVVPTDQPPMGGGSGSAPTPYAVFLSSMGTCAGIFVLGFCKQRGLSTEGIQIVQRVQRDPRTGLAGEVELEIQVPASFPEKYHSALVRSAEQCLVKQQFSAPPKFNIHTEIAQE